MIYFISVHISPDQQTVQHKENRAIIKRRQIFHLDVSQHFQITRDIDV